MVNIPDLILRLKENVKNYPEGIKPVYAEITETAFFPGGRGLYEDGGANLCKIMVVGQDFGNEKGYKKLKENGRKNLNGSPTWKNLIELLKGAGIDPKDCFFTNAIMGIREESKMMGRSIAFNEINAEFLNECRNFFLLQIHAIRPDKILLLGKQLIEFVSPLSDGLQDWKHIKGFSDMDAKDLAVKNNICFKINETEINATVIALTHPSMFNSNAKKRKYKGKEGKEAMQLMIREN